MKVAFNHVIYIYV